MAGVATGQPQSLGGEMIQMRCLDVLGSVTVQIAVAQVVC